MDNNQTWQIKEKKSEEMQNWKKQLLMDPILNVLFDNDVSADQFLTKKIYPLSHSQIAGLYSKLSTINFQLVQNIQKQVQAKSNLVQKSYQQFLDYKQQLEQPKQSTNPKTPKKSKPQQNLLYLKNFNKKYQNVQQSLILWKNITNCLHYSNQISNYRVNVNILKSMMKGYNGSQETINPIKIGKMLKDLIQVSSRHNFSGIKFYQSQRVFISSTKNIIHSIGSKSLPKLLQQYINSTQQPQQQQNPTKKSKKSQLQKTIQDWINTFHNLNTLKQFVVNCGKSILQDLAQNIKRYIKNDLVNLSTNLQGNLYVFIIEQCKILIVLQEKLVRLRKIELTNVPNLFVKFWEKLCQFTRQTILWIKKDQQLRNIPKNRQQAIVWKYPAFYNSFSKICSNIEIYLLQNTIYNTYPFAKNKQRLMISCLLQLGIQYHQQKQKYFTQIPKIVQKIRNRQQNQLKIQQKQEQNELKMYLSNIELIFSQAKCTAIFMLLMDALCQKLNFMSNQLHQNRSNGSVKQEQYINDVKLLNRIKELLKNIVKKYGGNFGVSKRHLRSFKIEK